MEIDEHHQEMISLSGTYTPKLVELVRKLLEIGDINYHLIESRTKDPTSIREKLLRRGIVKANERINDISGIRVIVYYQEDVERISDIIHKNFTVDFGNSVDKQDFLNYNEFGYLSRHYIVSLSQTRCELPEWKEYSRCQAEIQVRTVLQHAWAAISHELYYKKEYEIPKNLQRNLFRLAGLFELADEQFANIRRDHDLLVEKLERLSRTKELVGQKIDLLSLQFAMHTPSSIFKTVFRISQEAGLIIIDHELMDESNYSDILIICAILRLENIRQLEGIIEKEKTRYLGFFKELANVLPAYYGDYAFFNMVAGLFHLNEDQLNEFSDVTGWKNNFFQDIKRIILAQNS